MELHSIVESYKTLLSELSKHLKVIDKTLLKYLPKEDHKTVLESIIRDKETSQLLSESSHIYGSDIISNFIDIAKESLKLRIDSLKEAIAKKVSKSTVSLPMETRIDLYIDLALLFEAMRVAFNEEAAERLVKAVAESYKKRLESLKCIKGVVA